MKKIQLIVAGLLLALLFTNCDKKIETTRTEIDITNPERMATITLTGYADLNLKDIGDEEVPDSTMVIFKVDKGDFISGTDGSFSFEFQFQDGVLVAEVPTTESGVDYSIELPDFEFNTVLNPIDEPYRDVLLYNYAVSSSQDKDFNGVLIGDDLARDITYYADNDPVEQRWIETTCEIRGYFDEEESGVVLLEEEGVMLKFYNADKTWYQEASVVEGYVTMEFPEGETIYCIYEFQAEKNVAQGTSPETYNEEDYFYEGTVYLGAVETETRIINLTETGEPVEED